jgi:hypothetical protein
MVLNIAVGFRPTRRPRPKVLSPGDIGIRGTSGRLDEILGIKTAQRPRSGARADTPLTTEVLATGAAPPVDELMPFKG